MLRHLSIEGLATIESLSLELGAGFTVFSGETGAGKSILIEALGLVLGDRADTGMVRAGVKRAEISAVFELPALPDFAELLDEHGIEAEDALLVRRLVEAEGRSRAFINGSQVPLATLRQMMERVVDIHGQHEHQSLLRRPVQLAIVDRHADAVEDLDALATAFETWRSAQCELDALRTAVDDREHRLELLRHQVAELERLALAPGEFAELEAKQRRLANAEGLIEGLRTAAIHAAGDDSDADADASTQLRRALAALEPLRTVDPALGEIIELLDSAAIQVREAADALNHRLLDVELDPAELKQIDDRLGAAHELARKHRIEAEALPELLTQLSAERDALDDADGRIDAAAKALDAATADYRAAAEALSAKRQSAAADLSQQVSALMQELGMLDGRFEVAVTHQADGRFAAHGLDQVEFLVAINPGLPARPLAKVASGGELARISLALQVAAAADTDIPVLVFDEVDSGVGGGIAEIVGRRLRELGGTRQVLCVTHLAQVASQSHGHLAVEKLTDGSATRTGIRVLDEDARVREIGRMLGGVKITEQTLAHAREMLERAS